MSKPEQVTGQVLSLLMDYPDATYEEIGSMVHCSRQRVHQVAKKAGLTRTRPAHYRSDVTVDKVLELYHRDLLVKEIASTLGCGPSTVKGRLREAGITATAGECFSRRLDGRGKYRDEITVERVLNLYHNDLPIKEMAKTMGCELGTVRRRLMEAGISNSERYSRGARIRWERKRG